MPLPHRSSSLGPRSFKDVIKSFAGNPPFQMWVNGEKRMLEKGIILNKKLHIVKILLERTTELVRTVIAFDEACQLSWDKSTWTIVGERDG